MHILVLYALQDMLLGKREGRNEGATEKDGWRRKEAASLCASGRFQLVMETGVAHPAAVTGLTCPPDIHLQTFSSPRS